MHEYLTRRMVALKPMTYDSCDLSAGDEFMATPDDAGYFLKHGKAAEAKPVAAPVPAAVPAPPPAAVLAPPTVAAKRAGGRSRAEVLVPAAAPAQDLVTTASGLVTAAAPDSEEQGAA